MSGRSEGGGGGRLGALCGVSIAPHLQWVSEPPVGTLLGRLGAAGGLGEVPWDHSNIPLPSPARMPAPDSCGKQAPNYLCSFTFNLGASAPLYANSTAPLLEITPRATDSIPGQGGGSQDENKLKMKISSKLTTGFWPGGAIRSQPSSPRVAACGRAPRKEAEPLCGGFLPAQGSQPRFPGLGYTAGQAQKHGNEEVCPQKEAAWPQRGSQDTLGLLLTPNTGWSPNASPGRTVPCCCRRHLGKQFKVLEGGEINK